MATDGDFYLAIDTEVERPTRSAGHWPDRLEIVWRYAPADPQSDRESRCAPRKCSEIGRSSWSPARYLTIDAQALDPQKLARGYKPQRAPKLLNGQQTQSVPREHRSSEPVQGIPGGNGSPASKGQLEGDQPKVGLRLAAARREPEQVDKVPIVGGRIRETIDVQQEESQLKGSPLKRCIG